MKERTKEILIVSGLLTAFGFAMYGLNKFFTPVTHAELRRKEKEAREARDRK